MPYLDPELVNDETANAEAILAALADLIPGWDASEGHVETAQAEALGIVAATIAQLIIDREREDYAGFGVNVLGLPRGAAAVAAATVTITLRDNTGGTVPAGFEFTLSNPDGEPFAFATTAAAVVPAGQTQATGVIAEALEAGEAPNGATGTAVERDDLAIVTAVTTTAAASGGAEEEDLGEYVARVVDRARRVRALPITPEDHAAHALDVTWVARALAVNRRNPATGGADAPGHVTIYAVDVDGNPGSGPQIAALQAYYDLLDTVRGTTAHAAAPGTVDVAVAASVRPAAGVDPADAETAAEAAITAAFTRARWNLDEQSITLWKTQANGAKTELTRYDVAAAIDDLAEIASVVTVTIDGGAGPVAVPLTSVLRATPVAVTAV